MTGILIFTIGWFMFWGCSDTNVAGGGLDTETEGGQLSGIIVNPEGTAADTRITLVPRDFVLVGLSDSLRDAQLKKTLTDSEGAYVIELDTGYYNLEAINDENGKRVFVTGIYITAGDTVTGQMDTLQIASDLIIQTSQISTSTSGTLYFVGTTLSEPYQQTQGDVLVMADVPAGVLPSLYLADDNTSQQVKIADSLVLKPGETLVLGADEVQWKATKITLFLVFVTQFYPVW